MVLRTDSSCDWRCGGRTSLHDAPCHCQFTKASCATNRNCIQHIKHILFGAGGSLHSLSASFASKEGQRPR